MLAILLANARRNATATIRSAGWAQIAVVIAFAVVGAGVFVGAFFFFLRSFRFLLEVPDTGPLIIRYVLETSFAFVFFLGLVSFLVSSLPFFYRSEEMRQLMPFPIEPGTLFAYRFIAATVASSWSTLLIAVPALTALGVALGGGAAYALFAFCVISLFVLAIAASGGLLSFALAPVARLVPTLLLWWAGAIAFFAAAAGLVRLTIPRSVFTLFEVTGAAQVTESSRKIDAMFAALPSHPFARAAASVAESSSTSTAFSLALAALVIAALIALLFLIAGRVYLPLWQLYGERQFIAGPADARPLRRLRPFPRVFRAGNGFLLEKDLLMLVRDQNDLARAGFLGLLLAFSLLSMRAVAVAGGFDRAALYPSMLAFAFAAVGYFALTFAMRFVFPAFSREGGASSMVLASPIHVHEFFSWKFFFWSVLLAAITLPAVVVVSVLFAVPQPLTMFLLLTMAAASTTLTAMTLGQGTVFPRFKETDPDRIATSPAGLVATGVGFLYLLVIYRYVRDVTISYLKSGLVEPQAVFGILIVSFAIIGMYWAWATRSLERIEAGR